MAALPLSEKFALHAPALTKRLDTVAGTVCQVLIDSVDLVGKVCYTRGKVQSLEDGVAELKAKLVALKEHITKMQNCSSTLLSTVTKLFHYAGLEKNRVLKIEQTLREGNRSQFVSYIKQLGRYLTQSGDCLKDYLDHYGEATQQCQQLLQISSGKVKDAEAEEEARKRIQAYAVTGTVGVTGGASVATGLLTCGASVPVVVGVGAAAAVAAGGVAGAAMKKYNSGDGPQNALEIIRDIDQKVNEMSTLFTRINDCSKILETSVQDSIEVLNFVLNDSKPIDWQVPLQPETVFDMPALDKDYVFVPDGHDRDPMNDDDKPPVKSTKPDLGLLADAVKQEGYVPLDNDNRSDTTVPPEEAGRMPFSLVFESLVREVKGNCRCLVLCEQKVSCEMLKIE